MSGGYWNYSNDVLCREILGYECNTRSGLAGHEHDTCLKAIRHRNELNDPEISGLVYDLFCLLHSYDWAVSGDIDSEFFGGSGGSEEKYAPLRAYRVSGGDRGIVG